MLVLQTSTSFEDMWVHSIICRLLFVHIYQGWKDGVILSVLVYVDDLIITENSIKAIANFKKHLSTCFHMKDLGALKYFLGIEVACGLEGMFLCQRKYALNIISEARLLGAKPMTFPIEQNHHLALAQGDKFGDPEKYR